MHVGYSKCIIGLKAFVRLLKFFVFGLLFSGIGIHIGIGWHGIVESESDREGKKTYRDISRLDISSKQWPSIYPTVGGKEAVGFATVYSSFVIE